MKMMLFQPALCQMPEMTYTGTKAHGSPSRLASAGMMPVATIKRANKPVEGESRICSMATSTTVEMK